jgi:hypothetical protein
LIAVACPWLVVGLFILLIAVPSVAAPKSVWASTELREKNTSSNTGVTSNINNDADDTLDQEKEGGNGKTLTRRGYR